MREGGSPYRGSARADGPRLVLYPILHQRLLLLMLVLAVLPTGLYLAQWSRVVTVHCLPGAGRSYTCETREEPILGGQVERRELSEITGARLKGRWDEKRADTWIAVDTPEGTVALTRSFDSDNRAQLAAVERIDALVKAGHEPFTVSFGARSRGVYAPIMGWFFLLVGLFGFGMRAVLTVHGTDRVLVVGTRRFPLAEKRIQLPLDELAGFRWNNDSAGRPWVEAVMRSGQSVMLFMSHASLVEGVVERMAAMVRAAHED